MAPSECACLSARNLLSRNSRKALRTTGKPTRAGGNARAFRGFHGYRRIAPPIKASKARLIRQTKPARVHLSAADRSSCRRADRFAPGHPPTGERWRRVRANCGSFRSIWLDGEVCRPPGCMASPRCDHIGLGDPTLDLGGGSVLTAASILLVGTANYINLWSVHLRLGPSLPPRLAKSPRVNRRCTPGRRPHFDLRQRQVGRVEGGSSPPRPTQMGRPHALARTGRAFPASNRNLG